MSSKLHSKLDQLEHRAIPLVERIQERKAVIERLRQEIQPDVEQIVAMSRYCGLPVSDENREQAENELLETILLAEWYLGNGARTRERVLDAVTQAMIRLERELYGRDVTPEELDARDRLVAEVHEAMRAGVPAKDSEVARAMARAYGRKPLKNQTDAMTAYLAGAVRPDSNVDAQA